MPSWGNAAAITAPATAEYEPKRAENETRLESAMKAIIAYQRDHLPLLSRCRPGGSVTRPRTKDVPELPDIAAYITALETARRRLAARRRVDRKTVRAANDATAASAARGPMARPELRRVERIAIGFDGDYWLVLHHDRRTVALAAPWAKRLGPATLAALDFSNGSLATWKPAESGALRFTSSQATRLADLDPGGIDVPTCDPQAFATRSRKTDRSPRSTDPRHPQRHLQRLFRRTSTCRWALAHRLHPQTHAAVERSARPRRCDFN